MGFLTEKVETSYGVSLDRPNKSSLRFPNKPMTSKQFYDWQTGGGTNDVMKMIHTLESADIPWCAIGGIAVNHWAKEPMVTRDVDIVVATADAARTVEVLKQAGFSSEIFEGSVNFSGQSNVSIQLSTEACYQEFASRAIPADVHGILMRVATAKDTLDGKIRAWRDPSRRQSKRLKDLGDIVRMVEALPELRDSLPPDIAEQIE